MRDILFRGIPKGDVERHFFADIWKDNCEGSFVYGSLIISEDRYYICVSALCQINSCINNGMTSMIEVIPETVGQFTGKTVKTGKVFEDDIGKSIDGMFLIRWSEEKSAFVMSFYDYPYDELYLEEMWEDSEIIGNIHDNPELVKGATGDAREIG